MPPAAQKDTVLIHTIYEKSMKKKVMWNAALPEEIHWRTEVPRFKLISLPMYLAGGVVFSAGCLFFELMHEDFNLMPWKSLVMLPILAIIIYFLLYQLTPNLQIFFRIDKSGVYSETHLTKSRLIQYICLFKALYLSFRGSDEPYNRPHESSYRSLAWNEINSFKANAQWNKIYIKGGLKGTIILWTTDDVFEDACALLKARLKHKDSSPEKSPRRAVFVLKEDMKK